MFRSLRRLAAATAKPRNPQPNTQTSTNTKASTQTATNANTQVKPPTKTPTNTRNSTQSGTHTNTETKTRTPTPTTPEVIPDVFVTFGTRMNQITFVSHPGVMAVSKLLEMNTFTTMKAVLTQENVEAIKEFDEELAAKAQIAVDNDLAINFADMEYLDKPDVLKMFVEDKKQLEIIRNDVMNSKDYTFPHSLINYTRPEIPRKYRPELVKEQEMLEATPEGREYLALHLAAEEHIRKTTIPSSSTPLIGDKGQAKIE